MSSVFNDQDNEFDKNNLTNLDYITVMREPSSDNELANKNYVYGSIRVGSILGFNQTLQNYLKVSVGNDTNNLTNYGEIQTTDITIIKYLLQNWVIKCNDKNGAGKIQNFIKSTKTHSPTGCSGATSLLPIDDSFKFIETSSSNHGKNVFITSNEQILFKILI